MRMFSSQSKRRSGFTLIELLVVIAIIGTLASTVLVAVQDARVAGRDAKIRTDIKSVQTALELFRNANNRYPPHDASLNLRSLTGASNDIRPYLSGNEIPTNPHPAFSSLLLPTTINDYRYWTGGGHTGYTILVRFGKSTTTCSVSGGVNPPSWSVTHAPCF